VADASEPRFRYHPDPVASGVAQIAEMPCVVCGRADGLRYTGPFYSIDELDPPACLRCVADGSLAATWDGATVDVLGAPADVPEAVIDEIEHRTPSFEGWQQERWLFHCADGMAYVGRAASSMLENPQIAAAVDTAAADFGVDSDELARVMAHGAQASLLFHVFRCLHCGEHAAYGDPD
jgi:uncharacterized protein